MMLILGRVGLGSKVLVRVIVCFKEVIGNVCKGGNGREGGGFWRKGVFYFENFVVIERDIEMDLGIIFLYVFN